MYARASHEQMFWVMQALQPALAERVGAILIKNPKAEGPGSVGIASAVVLAIADKYIVVTAAHVVEDADVLAFAFAPRGAGTFSSLTWISDRRAYRVGGSGISLSGVDVACFEITAAELASWGVTPVGMDQVLVYQLAGDEFAILHGFPFERAEIEYGGSRSVFKHITFGTVGVPPNAWGPPYQRGVHQVVRYPRDGASPIGIHAPAEQRLPDPGGISGSGMWIVRWQDKRPFSFKDLALVGIEHSWLPEKEQIVGNGMEPVLTLISRAFPALAPTITAARVRVQQAEPPSDGTDPTSTAGDS